RTPLTLLLGPTESALASKDRALRGADLEMVHRNELRLLKLVNTLLDFSRIEAGRVQAAYEATDLCRLTADIASAFRSAMEKVGLKFTVECDDLGEPVYVDREMWEKVVLNLLSNAFKYTFSGEVALTLRNAGDMVELTVMDTGVGIPEAELPRVFERFHRVETTRARTHEGTGIGLALVEELVRLHGGSVSAKSVVGRGSTFFVRVPKGTDHLPAEQIGARRTLPSTALNGAVYIEEAAQWLPGDGASSPASAEKPSAPERPKILVVDDNADMRAYLAHLLRETYEVLTATDGEEAIETACRMHPALILSDVMMPGIDGFGLVRAVRNNPELRDTPVIMLSARAGEEAGVEGLDAGADDYLVKPFTAREMLARVAAHIRFAQLRDEAARRESRLETDKAEARHALSESERRFRALAIASSPSIYRMSADWKEMRHLRGKGFLSDSEEPNPHWMEEYIFTEDQRMVQAAIYEAIR
ncbi:MAG: ATP-binding response regulator, partial [Terracidiphilus sp.]